MPGRNSLSLLGEIFHHVGAHRRRQLYVTLGLMVAGAICEVVAIGSVVPFLALISTATPTRSTSQLMRLVAGLGHGLGISSVQLATAVLVTTAIVSALLRLRLAWSSQKLAFDLGHDFSTKIYSQLLHQPYLFHLHHNSSRLIVVINQVSVAVSGCLLPAMLVLSSAIVGLFIVAGLIAIDPAVAMMTAGGFGLIYAFVALTTKPRLRANSQAIVAAQLSQMQILREGLGGIRDILLGRSQDLFVRAFAKQEGQIRDRRGENSFIAAAPRFILEAGGVVLIAIVGLYVSGRPGGLLGSLPTLGALAVGAQRLLPTTQQIYNGYAAIVANSATVENVLHFLRMPAPVSDERQTVRALKPFVSRLTLQGVTVRYPTAEKNALDAIDLEIPKGARIGLIGTTGSGKSTLADVLMGLLPPSGGTLAIDGIPLGPETMTAWQAEIAHVPQAIYLADSSIAANIAFGVDAADIDMARVKDAARRARLGAFVEALPSGYDTVVGEGGIRLSGGQRQRIGIARALYRGGQILVLDEATSALDDATEAEVMRSIVDSSRTLTVLMIAHRLTTLASCDRIVRLENGRIVESGSFEQVVGR